MKVVKILSQWGIYSWATGFRPAPNKQYSLDEEARKNPEAVINRLLLEDREEEAERILDLYV